MSQAYFSPRLFAFLRELEKNNQRDWFLANKSRYDNDVKTPMLKFITDLGPGLQKISRHIVANPSGHGGSLFRIHRDTRFSTDKSPYKTHAAAFFHHDAGKQISAPGYYLHLGSDQKMAGGGVWHPDTPALKQIRDKISNDSLAWKKAKSSAQNFSLDYGDALAKVPRGYDKEHAFAEDLKRKDFVFTSDFSERDVCSKNFLSDYLAICRQSKPFVAFLAGAIDLPF